jgi:transposase InsO family protein
VSDRKRAALNQLIEEIMEYNTRRGHVALKENSNAEATS